jgi:transcriptional regulator with XRE-family HTH domain
MERRRPGDVERRLKAATPAAVRDTRLALGWSQARLAQRAGLTQSQVSRFETGRIEWVTLEEAARLLDVLGVRLDFALRRPYIANAPQQHDAAHAPCVGYASRRLTGLGWQVRQEIEIEGRSSHGWIDVLAYEPLRRAVLVCEIKTALPDFGEVQRQLAWYQHAASEVARAAGWQSQSITATLLVLATHDNDARIRANQDLVREAFPVRAIELERWLAAPEHGAATALALIDPRSRRRRWLIPTALDGRRSSLRYSSYADFMRTVRVKAA